MIKQFYIKQFKHKSFVCTQFKYQAILFEPLIGPNQVLQLQARVDQRVIAMKGYSPFSKAPALLEPQQLIVEYHIQDTCCC